MSFIKRLLSRDSSDLSKSPSFNDFSLNVGQDAEDELRRTSMDSDTRSCIEGRKSTSSVSSFNGSPTHTDVWQTVFNPGRNYNVVGDKMGRSYFDTVDDPKKQPTTWDYILKSENVRKVSEFDVNNDGFVTAEEVRSTLGSTQTIEDLIKKTDKHGDGRVAYREFFDLLREL
eukprot:g3549.t1